ncbi:phospholipid carrier-dependent glycosyltransferase [Novosphingobium tardum]|uniref:Polyprenol-phosphate-mannose--protein mannosyltransferase n=1 Tax=Novosphingobium tardum TaxID=1538021 RepID=A0ABV8RRQ0_9SPHN
MTARSDQPAESRDPLNLCLAIAGAFALLALNRLDIPTKPFFDEVHYLPAARDLLALTGTLNREHPMLGKEIIAGSMRLLGDDPWGWRLPSALAGTLALFVAMRAMWWASLSRVATIMFGVLLASNFMLLVAARIAMLDIYMFAFSMAGLWLVARAVRRPESARRDLALAGVAMGLALASKWTAAPVAAAPGLAFAAVRWKDLAGRRAAFVTARDAAPVRGMALVEAAMWLGVVPLAVYCASFAPAFFYANNPLSLARLVPYQFDMAHLQESVVQSHPYQSVWWQWLLDLRPIWYLYEVADGAQRGVLFIGNPVTMIAGLPALGWCAVHGVRARRADMAAAVILFLASLGMWLFADKPVQFYYHYMLPGTFLLAALALALAEAWKPGRRWPAVAVIGVGLAMFAWFYPILTAAPLAGDQSFLLYAWLPSWR